MIDSAAESESARDHRTPAGRRRDISRIRVICGRVGPARESSSESSRPDTVTATVTVTAANPAGTGASARVTGPGHGLRLFRVFADY
jgi:hypothetical protein